MKNKQIKYKNDATRKNVIYIDDKEIVLTERVIKMSRVTKVVKGGRRFSFNALTVVGDGLHYVGIGFGKAKEIPEAIRKSIEDAKSRLIRTKRQKNTIPHQVIGKFKSSSVLLKPGAPGTGIIAGEAVRAVVELAGYKDVLTKVRGSRNPLNITKAVVAGLASLLSVDDVRLRRQISLPEVFGEYSLSRRKTQPKLDSDSGDLKAGDSSGQSLENGIDKKTPLRVDASNAGVTTSEGVDNATKGNI